MPNQTILLVTSVEAEKQAILNGLGHTNQISVEIVGVGPMQAAVHTARLLMNKNYDLVINVGIAGGFVNEVEIGDIVVGTSTVAAELGSETKDGFLTLEELGFGESMFSSNPHHRSIIKNALDDKQYATRLGPILTVSTTTGTKETSEKLKRRFPSAIAEAMEGFGVATAANVFNVPMLEIRSISNRVGPRNKEEWKIKEALHQLTTVSSVIKELYT
ncbi:futalosine hydrolase [Alkalihalobacillus sp. LMS39]|uniref:futalosine hydrolase n=1 Tax=Alkalihalobacillus sp. LMS39 TaxID=2924032 RepID=UPI001FB2730C|nr:futalosine hydrolase [Alkalihalobacillus sp. LMS39]UOE92091.1 futalosine hydrolase [Alkalihalobacillus sp. LMS39]